MQIPEMVSLPLSASFVLYHHWKIVEATSTIDEDIYNSTGYIVRPK